MSTSYSLHCPPATTLARQACRPTSPKTFAAASVEARPDLVCTPAIDKTAHVREIFEHSLPFDCVDEDLAAPA